MFFKIGVLKNFAESTCGTTRACNYIKKRLQQRSFLVKFAKILRVAFFIEHLRWTPGTKGLKSYTKNWCHSLFKPNCVFVNQG